MRTYHKIQTVFFRDPDNNFKTLLINQFAKPEFKYLKDLEWIFTEKIDGTNIRLQWNGESIEIKGKTDKADLHRDLLANIEKTLQGWHATFPAIFKNPTDSPTEVCLYGEGYGAGIQKSGGNYQDTKEFVLFDVKIGNFWLQRKDVEDIANNLGINIVPIIGKGTLNDMVVMVKQGFKSQWGDFQAEGIVARPQTELMGRDGKRIITKLKFKDFI